MEQEAASGIYGELASEELNIVCNFIKKNMKLLEAASEVQKQRFTVDVKTSTEWNYMDEETYKELERLAESGITEKTYQGKLQKAYEQNKISLAEMRRLLQKFQK